MRPGLWSDKLSPSGMYWFSCTGFGSRFFVWYPDYYFIQTAMQSLANQIQMLKVNALAHLMVYLIDGGGSDSRCPCQVCLCPPKLAQLPGQ